MKMLRLAVLSACALTLASIAAPARAAGLPDFCTNPTAEQRANTALMDECHLMAQVDASIAALNQVVATVGQTLDGADLAIKALNNNLGKQLEK